MKKFLLAAVAILLVVLGTLLPLLRPVASRVTEDNFHRIKEGLSRKEVEDILGGPPGDYRTRPVITPTPSFFEGKCASGNPPFVEWYGDEGTVWIKFNDAGTVCEKSFTEAVGPKPGAVEALGWRWDRWRKSVFK